jgi:hypothetical protein
MGVFISFEGHWRLMVSAINLHSRMVLKSARCTVDMLSLILYDKTEDVGKQYLL